MKMTLVPQTDNKLKRHLVSKFWTKKKSAAIQLKFGMVAGIWLLYMPTKFQPNWQQKNSSEKILCLLWLLKPQMNVPLWWVIINIVSFKASTHLAFPSLFESSYLPFYGLNICKVVFCFPCKCVFNIRCVIPLCICLPGLACLTQFPRNVHSMFT